jgi:hypothetical protein
MSEKRTEERPQVVQASASQTDQADLRALAQRLREQAATVPAHLRDEAVAAAETVHAHAISERPDAVEMTPHLRRLEVYAELAPTVNAILQALSNVGF